MKYEVHQSKWFGCSFKYAKNVRQTLINEVLGIVAFFLQLLFFCFQGFRESVHSLRSYYPATSGYKGY